jgi:hypothetical protein
MEVLGMAAGMNTRPSIGLLRRGPRSRPKDAEDIPIGSVVTTPTGKEARVIGYRGFRRDHIVRLVCRYLEPENKRFDVVLLAPELVVVVKGGAA